MTKLAILADIHGNLPALETVVQDFQQFDVDHVVVAGDLINWGPFSAEVVEIATRAGWSMIRGNAEYYLLDYETPRAPAAWSDRSQFSLLPWLRRQLDGRWRTIIGAWPDTLCLRFPDAPPIRVAHGTPRSPWEPIYPNSPEEEIASRLDGVSETTLVVGHTHLPMDRTIGRWHILNPGPVGVPLDGIFMASYMLLDGNADGWRPTFRRVAFDYAPVYQEFERQRFVDECGVVGHLVLEEFRTARLQLHTFLRWRNACCPSAPLTMELLDEFRRADTSPYTPPQYRLSPQT